MPVVSDPSFRALRSDALLADFRAGHLTLGNLHRLDLEAPTPNDRAAVRLAVEVAISTMGKPIPLRGHRTRRKARP